MNDLMVWITLFYIILLLTFFVFIRNFLTKRKEMQRKIDELQVQVQELTDHKKPR
ncbi:hypothetical protein [Fictibacillus macauensis]|uniref:hypothetical protein n=1 Tax=Fictibacillus macauensis TaxID=245160 RepID=UPI0003091A66|nr:hypothetical protein [Fictibacillus macauensis]